MGAMPGGGGRGALRAACPAGRSCRVKPQMPGAPAGCRPRALPAAGPATAPAARSGRAPPARGLPQDGPSAQPEGCCAGLPAGGAGAAPWARGWGHWVVKGAGGQAAPTHGGRRLQPRGQSIRGIERGVGPAQAAWAGAWSLLRPMLGQLASPQGIGGRTTAAAPPPCSPTLPLPATPKQAPLGASSPSPAGLQHLRHGEPRAPGAAPAAPPHPNRGRARAGGPAPGGSRQAGAARAPPRACGICC